MSAPDLDMGEKLLATFKASFVGNGDPTPYIEARWPFLTWCETNLPALLATARRVAEMEGENKRLKSAILTALRSTAGREYLLIDLAANAGAGFTADELLAPTASALAHEAECQSAALAAIRERKSP